MSELKQTTERTTKDNKHEDYLQERKLLLNAKFQGSLLFDKAILTLAAGALGLSLTFIRQISPVITEGTVWMIIFAWICFIVSLLSTLISILTSRSACVTQIEILEIEDEEKQDMQKNTFTAVTQFLNIVSIIFFIAGVILLTVFSIRNLL